MTNCFNNLVKRHCRRLEVIAKLACDLQLTHQRSNIVARIASLLAELRQTWPSELRLPRHNSSPLPALVEGFVRTGVTTYDLLIEPTF